MKVLNKHNDFIPETGVVWIMRGYKYGNPFIMKNKSIKERNRVCDEFNIYADNKFTDKEIINDLDDQDLVCCCTPQRCHGDYLIQRVRRIHGLPTKEKLNR